MERAITILGTLLLLIIPFDAVETTSRFTIKYVFLIKV